jgi:hypothetical protein
MNTLTPSPDEFLTQARQAFGFLSPEYGFAETTPSAPPLTDKQFRLRYENATTAVLIEGQSWGTTATVSIGEKDLQQESSFALVPLWTIARLKGAEHEAALQKPGQLAQIEASAAVLRSLAGEALQGKFSEVEAARNYLEERVRHATRG